MQAQWNEDSDITEALYRDLRRRAQFFLGGERAGHTLQPTEIVHEAWLRISSGAGKIPCSRNHFLAIAGRVMRNLLVDHARARGAYRRGGDLVRIDLDHDVLFAFENHVQVLEIDRMLHRLAKIDARAAQVVELRFFAGLTEPEIAVLLDVSPRSVKRDWALAKGWIRCELG